MEKKEEFQKIQNGLALNPYDFNMYVLLGEYYKREEKLAQAYISYCQARFYCDIPSEKENIENEIEKLKEKGGYVPKTAFVILSWNLKDYTAQCINSIRQTTDPLEREIIVVDNGSTDESVSWLKEQDDLILQLNEDNHGFPMGCNEGIALSSKDADIFLLNNDTVLPPNALFWLKIGLYENEYVGATGSMSNYVSNNQLIQIPFQSPMEVIDYAVKTNVFMEEPYICNKYLVGFALLMKRSVLDEIGWLDERFSPGNAEDVDICIRMRIAGYQNLVCKNSVILHFGSQSFQQLGDEFHAVMLKNIEKLNEKYGCDMRQVLHSDDLFDKFLKQMRDVS